MSCGCKKHGTWLEGCGPMRRIIELEAEVQQLREAGLKLLPFLPVNSSRHGASKGTEHATAVVAMAEALAATEPNGESSIRVVLGAKDNPKPEDFVAPYPEDFPPYSKVYRQWEGSWYCNACGHKHEGPIFLNICEKCPCPLRELPPLEL